MHHSAKRIRRRLSQLELLEWRLCLSAMRIVNWNTANGPDNSSEDALFRTVFEAIGNENVQGNILRPAVVALQETDSSASRIENILDTLYPSTNYVSIITGLDSGGDATGFVYDVSAVSLLSSLSLPGNFTHDVLRAEFRPIGTTGSEDFFIYTTHLKAGSTGDNEATRGDEAALIRANADSLGQGTNIIVTGDFNIKDSNESAYFEFLAPGPGQLQDPINRPGNWNNNNSFKDIHTQNPSNNPSGGGMDDRFDFQLGSGELFDGIGFEYIVGSYHTFGNNGTHALNSGIDSGNGASPAVLAALATASDHLPVVVDYEYDDEPAGITITESGGQTITAEGRYVDTYMVVLDTVPTGNVEITINTDGQTLVGNGGSQSVTLTFTPQNAETPQTVLVQAVDDATAEGNHLSYLTHSVSSSDSEYAALSPIGLEVLVVDDEAPTLLINEVNTFDGTTGKANQFIELYDGGIGGTSLNGHSLVLYDGTTDQVYASIPLDGFSTDDAGLFLLGASGIGQTDLTFADGLLQGGMDAVAIYDDDASAYPVGSGVTTDNLLDAIVYGTTASLDPGLAPLLISGQPRVNENQNGLQNTQSMARIGDGGQARQTATYQIVTPTPGALNTPRSPGLTILGQHDLQVSESGVTDSFAIALDSLPTADVIITLNPNADLDLGNGFGLPIELTFSASNALELQSVLIQAFDDAISEGPHSGVITVSVASNDANYNALNLADIGVAIEDDEPAPTPSIVISEIMYNPRSMEGSFSAEWVELVNTGTATTDLAGWRLSDEDASPTWGVIPSLTELAPGETAILYDATFVNEQGFRSAWSIPASVQVIGISWGELDNSPSNTNEILQLLDSGGNTQDLVNFDDEGAWPTDDPDGASIYLTDLLADNNVGGNWARSSVGTADARNANGFPFSSVDTGSPGDYPQFVLPGGVTVTASGGTTEVSEDGTQDILSITLDSVPTDDVTITITPDAHLNLGSGPGVAIDLLFTPGSAFTPQSVVVSAVDDMIVEGEHFGNISFLVSSNDAGYQNIQVADVTATITDNDSLPPRVSLHGEAVQYTGPGQYWFDYYVTATDGPIDITSFTLPFAFDVPGVTFSGMAADFVANPSFGFSNVGPFSAPFVADYGLVAAVDGLSLLDQQSAVLFSIQLTVDGSFVPSAETLVGEVVRDGFDGNILVVSDASQQAIAIEDLDFGKGLTLLGDTTAPTVLDVKIASSSWTPTFKSEVDAADGFGFQLEGADQLRNLTWTQLDTLIIEFSEDIGTFTNADFSLVGINVADYAAVVNSVSYDPSTFKATINLSAPIGADKLLLQINDSVTDLAGNSLDGEWIDTVSTESGNGEAGGDFHLRFDVLPGNVLNNDFVGALDVLQVNANTLTFTGLPGYDPFNDLDGDGFVTSLDVLATNDRTVTFLPFGEPAPPASLTLASLSNLSDEEDEDSWSDSVDLLFRSIEDETLMQR